MLLGAAVAAVVCLCVGVILSLRGGLELAREAPFSNPPLEIDPGQLAGIWRTDYMEWGKDVIEIRPDGSFQQIYRESTPGGAEYRFESPVGKSWIEQLDDGGAYLHLEGARYFLAGKSLWQFAHGPSLSAYDWIRGVYVGMDDELVLNVRITSDGELLLLHLWTSSDRGFPIIGGEDEIFRREGPS